MFKDGRVSKQSCRKFWCYYSWRSYEILLPAKEWDSDLITLLQRMLSAVIHILSVEQLRFTEILSERVRLHRPAGSYMKSCYMAGYQSSIKGPNF